MPGTPDDQRSVATMMKLNMKIADITKVRTQPDIQTVKTLFKEYANSLNIDLSFQQFESELELLPGQYGPGEKGELLLAWKHEQPIGCVALRRLKINTRHQEQVTGQERLNEIGSKVAEMKRLYLVPSARGTGIAGALVSRIIEVARELGYNEIRLDTLPSMVGAQALYKKFGFDEIEAYCFNPVEGTKFLGLKL